MSTPTTTHAITLAAQDGPWAQLRTGVIVEASGTSVVILVGAATFPASVVVPFGITDPAAAVPTVGTLVAVGRQDSSWTVFGSVLGVSGNLIVDGSFEETAPGVKPEAWTLYNVSGASAAVVEAFSSPVAGAHVLNVTGVTVPATALMLSSAVQVEAGVRYQLSAFVGAEYEDEVAHTADASILASWFADDTDAYPTVASPDILVATALDVAPAPPWTPLSGSVVAPITGVMRLSLRSITTGGQTLLWDFASVRRFG